MIYENNRLFSDQYINQLKEICGRIFFKIAPLEIDMKQATDLVVLNSKDDLTIGCRVRRNCYYKKYPNQFTIRCSVPSDVKTEWHKILEGWCKYFLYGFTDQEEIKIQSWMIGAMDIFRKQISQWLDYGEEPWEFQKNKDGTKFNCFDYRKFPPEFIIAAQEWGIPPINKEK